MKMDDIIFFVFWPLVGLIFGSAVGLCFFLLFWLSGKL